MEMQQQLPAFSPGSAGAGGLILGMAVVGKLAMTGRTLGISGAVKGLVASPGPVNAWRIAFLVGLVGSGVLADVPGIAFETHGSSVSLARSVLAGILVGWGTASANGCTSGHGICGNARLSPRSIVATMVFMATGAITATVTETSKALGSPTVDTMGTHVPVMMRIQWWPSPTHAARAGIATAVSAAVLLATHALAKKITGDSKLENRYKVALDLLSETVTGAVFGTGLLISGMTDPSKVAGFLTLHWATWDPSLAVVMAGALAVVAPSYHWLTSQPGGMKPACGQSWTPPPGKGAPINASLIIGAATFGIGWGLAGGCPGPVMVRMLSSSVDIVNPLVWLLSFIGGQWIHTSSI